MKRTYVVAGSIKRDGKLVRGAAIVDVEGKDEFDMEMHALDALPIECHQQRKGKHVPECWPLDSAQGTRLAMAAGLVKPIPALA